MLCDDEGDYLVCDFYQFDWPEVLQEVCRAFLEQERNIFPFQYSSMLFPSNSSLTVERRACLLSSESCV